MTSHMEELYKRIFGFYPVASMNDAEMADAIAERHEVLRKGEQFEFEHWDGFSDGLTTYELERWVYVLDPSNVEDGGGMLVVMKDRLKHIYTDRLKAHFKANPSIVAPSAKGAYNQLARSIAHQLDVPFELVKHYLQFQKDAANE